MEISTYTAAATQTFSSTTMQLAVRAEQNTDAQSQQVGYGRGVDTYNSPRRGHCHHGHHGHHQGHQQRAMGVFKQELSAMFSASFGAQFMSSSNPYSSAGSEQSSGEVSASTLNSAQQVVAQAPDQGSKSLLLIRQKVETAATVARQTVGNDSDIQEVENSVEKLNAGLDQLDAASATVVTSSSSVLHVNTMKKEQSAISINTQEGDVVTLNLNQITHSAVSDFSVSNEHGSSSATSVKLSEHSNYMLKIDGNINDDELEAIKNVFAQAESIANEFFDGDIATALEMSSGIDYDQEQLSQVNLRFRSVESSSSYYSQYTQTRTTPVNNSPAPTDSIANTESVASETPAVESQSPVEVAPAEVAAVSAETNVAEVAATPEEEVVAQETEPVAKEDAMNGFFDLLSGFLKKTSVAFQSASSGNTDSSSFYHSQSFKLDVLKVVIELKSPEEAVLASEQAAELIEGVKELEPVKV